MARTILEELLLFLVPFALFALYLLARRRNPARWAHWSDQAATLVLTGLGVAVAALVVTGLTARREAGGFVPTHMENGRVVPGTFR